jgi:hypothetical protein
MYFVLLYFENLTNAIKVFRQLMHKRIVLKTILKFTLKLTLKQLRHVSVQSHHQQGAHYTLPDDGVTAPKHVGAALMSFVV